jgi:hypothetical protein
MIRQVKVNSGQIVDRFLCLLLVLGVSSPGWTSGESVQTKYSVFDRLEVVSEAMQEIDILDMTSAVPISWQVIKPSSKMRLAQFAISDERQAEVVVFYFGVGQGGGAQANIDRWVSQFKPVNGKPVQPRVKNLTTTGGFAVTWVEIQGDYARGVGVGPIGDFKSDRMLIAAITETPHGNLYIQFHGDNKTILEHRDEFSQFVMALRKKSA